MNFIDAHEEIGEIVKVLDKSLAKWLNKLDSENLLEDTTIVYLSDHGLHMNGLFYLFNID